MDFCAQRNDVHGFNEDSLNELYAELDGSPLAAQSNFSFQNRRTRTD
jgi:hypothetical protein